MKQNLFFGVCILMILLSFSIVHADEITYIVTFAALENETIMYENITATVDCESRCSYAMPIFSRNATITNITLTPVVGASSTMYFKSTRTAVTTDLYDEIIVEVPVVSLNATNETNENVTAALLCTSTQCDRGCIKCPDLKCHDPGYTCTEDLAIEKIVPKTFSQGEQQVNILIKNGGDIPFQKVSASITGYGITTLNTIPIDSLATGDKDYTFVVVNASESGIIDIIIKLYAEDIFKKQVVDQITILVENSTPNAVPTVDTALIQEEWNNTKATFVQLESLYTQKKEEGYLVEDMLDSLNSIRGFIRNAQLAVAEEDYKGFRKNIDSATTEMALLAERLTAAHKQKKSWKLTIQENIAWIGSIFGFIIATSTVYGITRSYIQKSKVEKVVNISKQIINVGQEKKKK